MPGLPRAAPEEPPELRLDRTTPPLRLLLKRAKGRELPAPLEHILDTRGPERADQLALEVGVADVEAERLELVARAGRTDTCALERSSVRAGLADVAEAGRANVVPVGRSRTGLRHVRRRSRRPRRPRDRGRARDGARAPRVPPGRSAPRRGRPSACVSRDPPLQYQSVQPIRGAVGIRDAQRQALASDGGRRVDGRAAPARQARGGRRPLPAVHRARRGVWPVQLFGREDGDHPQGTLVAALPA